MSEIITINDTEFDLGTAQGCAEAKKYVAEYIEALLTKKQNLVDKLKASFLGFKESKKLRTSSQETEAELSHCQELLKNLETKHDEISKKEEIAAAQEEIARVEKQTAALAAVCEKEIPPASRKLAVIAAALQRNLNERESMVDRAENAGLDTPEMHDPLQRIAGDRTFASRWLRHLYLPLLDEQPEILSFWPLPNVEHYTNTHQDNPKINDDVEELFSADDMLKAAKALFAKIEKRKVVIREVEDVDSHIIQEYKPMWYELPPGERKRDPLDLSVRTVSNKVEFWLGLEERRKMNAFIHFLNPKERDEAMKQTPEDERQKYLDYLIEHASNDTSDEGPEPLEATG